MAIPFLNGIDVTGTVDLSNLTIDGAQGTDGQVLTSTGTGIAWEDASGGASLSGGEASKVAVWSATDTLTHNDNFHFDTTNVRLGIGTTAPATKLEIVDDLSAASTVEYALTLSVKDDNNSINQLGGEGVGIKFKIAGNDATDPGNTFIGAGIAAVREVASDTDSSTGLAFSVSQNDENLDEAVRIDHDGNVGIGETTPDRPLVVSETRTDSTASDAYTTVVKSVQGSGLSTNPGTGGLKVQYTSSSSNVHAFGLVAGSSSSDFLTTGPMHFYTNSDLDTVSATGFAMQLDTSQRLILGSTTATQKLNVDGNVKANRYYGHSSTSYYVDPDDGTASAVLLGAVSVGSGSVYTKFTVSTPAGYGDGADGIFIRSQFAGGSPVVSDKDPFLSIGCADSSSAVSTIFMGQDATATSQETKIEYSHDNDTLSIYKKQMGSYTEHVRFGNVGSSGTARTRFYGNVGIGTNPASNLHVSSGTSGDATVIIEADTDNNNEGDHPSIRLKQDNTLVDYRLGLGLTDGDTGTTNNDFVITNITNNSATSFRFSPDNGTNSYLVFHDNYHPNADTWTTARTITIGNTGKSVNGSGNVGWTLAEIGAQAAGSYAAAGDENIIDGALSIWNADGDGDVFTYNDANPTHNGDQVGCCY